MLCLWRARGHASSCRNAAPFSRRKMSCQTTYSTAGHACLGGPSHSACDVLIVDGTNLLCISQPGAKAAAWDPCHQKSQPAMPQLHAASFRAWLEFTLTAAEPTTAAIVVFDDKGSAEPGSSGQQEVTQAGLNKRKLHVPSYLDKRHAKRDRRRPSSSGSDSSSTAARATNNQRRLSRFATVAEDLGFAVVWANPGWEADDMIGSLIMGLVGTGPGRQGAEDVLGATAPQQRQPAGREFSACDSTGTQVPERLRHITNITVASGDSDMQQLLALGAPCHGHDAWQQATAAPSGSHHGSYEPCEPQGAGRPGTPPSSSSGSASDANSACEPLPLGGAASAVMAVTWLEFLQWPSLSLQGGKEQPSAMRTSTLAGLSWLPVRLHQPILSSPIDPDLLSRPETHAALTSTGQSPTLGHNQSAPPPSSDSRIPPALYPDYLALVGKPDSGVKGVGISTSAAKTLLRKVGGISTITQAHRSGLLDDELRMQAPATPKAQAGKRSGQMLSQHSTGAVGGAGSEVHPAEGQAAAEEVAVTGGCPPRNSGERTVEGAGDRAGAKSRLETSLPRSPMTRVAQAQRNLQATRIHCDPGSVPWQALADALQAMPRETWHSLQRPGQSQDQGSRSMSPSVTSESRAAREGARGEPQEPRHGGKQQRQPPAMPCPGFTTPLADVLGREVLADCRSALVLSHPQHRWHAVSSAVYVHKLAAALKRAGIAHDVWHVTDQGALVDIAIRFAPPAQQSMSDAPTAVGIQLLSPADFAPLPTSTANSSLMRGADAGPGAKLGGVVAPVERLGQHLSTIIGPRASVEQLPQKLKAALTGYAQLHLKHVRGQRGWLVAVAPFYELEHDGGIDALVDWVESQLPEQGH